MLVWPLCAALLSSSAAAPDAESAWYRGLIGRTATALDTPERYEKNKEVEMQLRLRGSSVAGTYFYFDTGKGERGADIAIRGRVTEDKLQLEELGDGSRITGRWQGVVSGLDFAGTWTDPAGKRKLPFFLQRLPDEDATERPLAPGISYRRSRVVGTNLVLPVLSQHPSPAVMKKVNDAIRAAFEGHRCNPSFEFPAWPDDYHLDWKLSYASADLFSVSASEERFCGAAYPTSEDRSFTFDLRTGRPIAFEDLFRDYQKNKGAILETLFADSLKNASQECKDIARDAATDAGPGPRFVSGSFGFSLSPTALRAQEIDLVHAVAACGVEAEVPYAKLRRFATPGGPIARILEPEQKRR